MDFIGPLLVLCSALTLGIILYFLPTIVAGQRQVTSRAALFWVDLLFGWTIFDWFICSLWAAFGQSEDQATFYRTNAYAIRHGRSAVGG